MPAFRLTLLGAFTLSGGAPCVVLSKKAQALLALLAMPPGQVHRRDKLASMLWGDRSEESARQNLRQCLTAIRRACEGSEALPIITEGDLLRLDPTSVAIDICEFEEALRTRLPKDLERALALYRGELLEGLNLQGQQFEEWLVGERRRLRTLAIDGLVQLLGLQEQSGARERATQTAMRLVTIDPLQEPVHRSLMRLYHDTGNTAQALRQYGICEKTLRRELNVEPEAATKELRRQILRTRNSVRPRADVDGSDAAQTRRAEMSLPSGGDVLSQIDTPIVPSDRPSVAVLPFLGKASDPEHGYLADSIAEDIITALSGIERVMVIARSSSFAYKGKEIDAKQAGRELGVAHIVEGSVRTSGDRIRISAQLVDASTGMHVWADHYDRDMRNAFAVPDDITQEIVTALAVKLTHGEQIRNWRCDAVSPEAYRHFARGIEAYLTFSRSGMARAREEFERAISINPRFATAFASLGFTHASDARFRWNSSREGALSMARNAARTALSFDARCGMAHSLLAYVAMQDHQFEDAIAEGGHAVAIHPGDAEAYHMLAMARIYNGDFIEGARLEQRSLRLNPLALENSLVELGRAYFHLGRFDDATTVLDRVCRAKPNWLTARTLLAGCHCEGGRPDLARQSAAEILKIKPDFSLMWWAQSQLYRRKEDLDLHLSALRLVGLPEVTSHPGSRFAVEPEAATKELRRQILRSRSPSSRRFDSDHDEVRSAAHSDPSLPSGREILCKVGGPIAPSDRPALALPDKPSIALLPFDNMSDSAGDVYFADGIAEEIITELSRYPDLFVAARNSSFTYRDKAVRVTDVARELGVHFVLEGSVRRAGSRIRINTQLIDGASGTHLWAQRYDRSLEDIFAVQDDVTQSIVAVLPARVEAAALERASRKTSSSLDAYDNFLRGKYCHHLENLQANREAEAHFDRSIHLDSRFASAYAWKACTLGQSWVQEFRPRTPELLQQIVQLIEHATGIDENDTECHRMRCRIALIEAQFAKSEYHLERALALNPNDPRLVVQRGINLTFLGEPDAAIPWIERAMRLDPFSAHRYCLDLVRALFMAHRPAEAIAVLERSSREHWEDHLWLAACYAAANEQAAAHQALQTVTSLRPQLSIGSYLDWRFKWKRAEDRSRLCHALEQAGLTP